jgi:hypothetical protein
MSVISGLVGAAATSSAASSASNTAQQGQDLQWKMFQQQYNDPFNVAARGQGTQAVNQLGTNTLAGQYGKQFTEQDFKNSALYNSLLSANQTGREGLSAQGAASGMLGSGNMANALQVNAQANTAQYEPLAYQQWNSSNITGLNALQSLSGLGQTQANVVGAAGQNTAANMANTGLYGAQMAGNYGIQTANQLANVGRGAAQGYNLYNQNQQYQNYLNSQNPNYLNPQQYQDAFGGVGANTGASANNWGGQLDLSQIENW